MPYFDTVMGLEVQHLEARHLQLENEIFNLKCENVYFGQELNGARKDLQLSMENGSKLEKDLNELKNSFSFIFPEEDTGKPSIRDRVHRNENFVEIIPV